SQYCEVESWTDPIYKSCINDSCNMKRSGEKWSDPYDSGWKPTTFFGDERFFSIDGACRERHGDFIRAERVSRDEAGCDIFKRCSKMKLNYHCLIPTYSRDSCPNVNCGEEVAKAPKEFKACQHEMHGFDLQFIKKEWNLVNDPNVLALLRVLILIQENRSIIKEEEFSFFIEKLNHIQDITYTDAYKLNTIAEILERNPQEFRKNILSQILEN
ncbi:MAG: hypothetical protein V9E86_08390, partial [Nitrosomonas sp.]